MREHSSLAPVLHAEHSSLASVNPNMNAGAPVSGSCEPRPERLAGIWTAWSRLVYDDDDDADDDDVDDDDDEHDDDDDDGTDDEDDVDGDDVDGCCLFSMPMLRTYYFPYPVSIRTYYVRTKLVL